MYRELSDRNVEEEGEGRREEGQDIQYIAVNSCTLSCICDENRVGYSSCSPGAWQLLYCGRGIFTKDM